MLDFNQTIKTNNNRVSVPKCKKIWKINLCKIVGNYKNQEDLDIRNQSTLFQLNKKESKLKLMVKDILKLVKYKYMMKSNPWISQIK